MSGEFRLFSKSFGALLHSWGFVLAITVSVSFFAANDASAQFSIKPPKVGGWAGQAGKKISNHAKGRYFSSPSEGDSNLGGPSGLVEGNHPHSSSRNRQLAADANRFAKAHAKQ